MEKYKVFTINPGSTSTKVALFENDEMLFKVTVVHEASELAKFAEVADQYEYRYETIMRVLEEQGQSLEGLSAVSARGGSIKPCEGGVYHINDKLIEDALSKETPNHPAMLGAPIAKKIAEQYNVPYFTVNTPDTDEFIDEARVTGIKDVYRSSSAHALNQKETAIRVAAEMGKKYDECNFIVCHLGGGCSITAHRKGRSIDSTDIINGDGPMAPTRCGAMPVKEILKLAYSGKYTYAEMNTLITKSAGFVSHLGTSEMLDVVKMVEEGDKYAELIYNAFIYQCGKFVGSMAAVLCGKVDAIILTGGIAHNVKAMDKLEEMVGFIAPVIRRPGEFEMEALAAGAIRVLKGEEQPKVYTGIPPFQGFDKGIHA